MHILIRVDDITRFCSLPLYACLKWEIGKFGGIGVEFLHESLERSRERASILGGVPVFILATEHPIPESCSVKPNEGDSPFYTMNYFIADIKSSVEKSSCS